MSFRVADTRCSCTRYWYDGFCQHTQSADRIQVTRMRNCEECKGKSLKGEWCDTCHKNRYLLGTKPA